MSGGTPATAGADGTLAPEELVTCDSGTWPDEEVDVHHKAAALLGSASEVHQPPRQKGRHRPQQRRVDRQRRAERYAGASKSSTRPRGSETGVRGQVQRNRGSRAALGRTHRLLAREGAGVGACCEANHFQVLLRCTQRNRILRARRRIRFRCVQRQRRTWSSSQNSAPHAHGHREPQPRANSPL